YVCLVLFGMYRHLFDLVLGVSEQQPDFLSANLWSPVVDCAQAVKVQVWIDFSSPEGLQSLLPVAEKNKSAVVSGSTGLTEAHFEQIQIAAKKIPVLWASNMSLGVALLSKALEVFAQFHDFDFQIEEIHHNKKKDIPSGTALSLQKKLEEVIGQKTPLPLGLRGGGVFGVHRVFAFAEEEYLNFEHHALNRAVFAKGAIKAAEWLYKKAPGLYEIKEVLN
ncbi:MAG: 4-hydroxy-tetrahydrodipicolinate reductase, partial [Pseudobdellovibrionaceae bacterium]